MVILLKKKCKVGILVPSNYFVLTGSNQGSDLQMRFADEPLYQFYAALISEVSFILAFRFIECALNYAYIDTCNRCFIYMDFFFF